VIKGAFVKLASDFGTAVPEVVIFQFNPESLRHGLSHRGEGGAQHEKSGSNPQAVSGNPDETYSFTLSMDAADQLTDPNPAIRSAAVLAGIHPRLAALELLLFPPDPAPDAKAAGDGRSTPAAQLPAVLFVWGAGRILPVRVTSLTVTETLYDERLNPTHADAQLELRVLTETEAASIPGKLGRLAMVAYRYSQRFRLSMAATNLGASSQATIGMVRGAVPLG
jgi:hypothetical protein